VTEESFFELMNSFLKQLRTAVPRQRNFLERLGKVLDERFDPTVTKGIHYY